MKDGDDRLVADYLSRLVACAASLPPDRRDELVEEISAHIAEARLGATADRSGSGVRAILDRLGDPNDIVRAAAEQAGMPAAGPGLPGSATAVGGGGSQDWMQAGGTTGPTSGRRLGALENCAVALLLVGGFLFLIGWIVGVVLLWSSPRWRVSDKVLGTLVWPGGLALLLPALSFAALSSASACSARTCAGPSGAGWTVLALTVAIGIAAPILVAIRLVRHARAMPAEPTGEHRTLRSSY
jgi:hypothetical protein